MCLGLSDGTLLCSAEGRTHRIYFSAPLLPFPLPHFLRQMGFLLLVIHRLFLFLLLLPTQARTVGAFWNSSLNLTFARGFQSSSHSADVWGLAVPTVTESSSVPRQWAAVLRPVGRGFKQCSPFCSTVLSSVSRLHLSVQPTQLT